MTTTLGPALGHGLVMSQQGTGTTPGYDAVDVRRMFQGLGAEGVLSSGGFAVSQRGAGANLSVDIAATTGEGARIQGDAVTLQGLYYVPPASAVINEVIAAADATNPRNDLVVLEIKDSTHDASGSNLAQTRVVTGTPNVSATQTDAYGVNGTPALPVSAIPLAVVNVPALDTAITTSQVDDRRPQVWRGGSGGKTNIATAETRASATFGKLTTPDIVRSVVLPTDGLIFVAYQATWQESVAGQAQADIFLNATQLKVVDVAFAGATSTSAATGASSTVNRDVSLFSGPLGLASIPSQAAVAYATGDATTGQLVGANTANVKSAGGPTTIFAAAGTYDVSVQFKAISGSVTAKNRRLWVWTMAFG